VVLARRSLVAATRDAEFWRCYAFDGDDGFDFETTGERLARRLNGVDEDEEADDDLSSIQTMLPARRRPGRWLRLEMNFELALHVLYLSRADADDEDDYAEEEYDPVDEDECDCGDCDDDYWGIVPDVSFELGHLDQARWHPFCLRWSEMEAVVAQMRAAPGLHPLSPEVGMLLLARWVGHGSDEAALLKERREIIASTFEQLDLFHGEDAVRMAAQILQAVPDDDYAWRWDDERGWLFSGDYAGYSVRNDCHDRFPFAEFTELRRQLGVADGPEARSDRS
jgi:hypothetical protein